MKIINYLLIFACLFNFSFSLFAQRGMELDQGQILFQENGATEAFIDFSTPSCRIKNNSLDVIEGNLKLETAAGNLHVNSGANLQLNAKYNIHMKIDGNTRMSVLSSGKINVGSGTTQDARMEIAHNGSFANPHLRLFERSPNDAPQLQFQSANHGGRYWTLAGSVSSTSSVMSLLHFDGTSGQLAWQYLTKEQVLKVTGDISPSSSSWDLGQYTAANHWDDVIANDFVTFSDKRLKKNFQPIENVLPKLMQLDPVSYQYIRTHSHDDRLRFGLVAQEVQKIFPNVVIEEDVDLDKNGKVKRTQNEHLSMNYLDLIPVTIRGIQELSTQLGDKEKMLKKQAQRIIDLEQQLNKMNVAHRQRTTTLENRLAKVEMLLTENVNIRASEVNTTDIQLNNDGGAYLEQNQPNPFNQNTTINYFLPKYAQGAKVSFIDIHGRVLKEVHLTKVGQGQIHLQAADLPSGIYNYVLVVDGQKVSTKKMVLAAH